jgi:hypothetical protein
MTVEIKCRKFLFIVVVMLIPGIIFGQADKDKDITLSKKDPYRLDQTFYFNKKIFFTAKTREVQVQSYFYMNTRNGLTGYDAGLAKQLGKDYFEKNEEKTRVGDKSQYDSEYYQGVDMNGGGMFVLMSDNAQRNAIDHEILRLKKQLTDKKVLSPSVSEKDKVTAKKESSCLQEKINLINQLLEDYRLIDSKYPENEQQRFIQKLQLMNTRLMPSLQTPCDK